MTNGDDLQMQYSPSRWANRLTPETIIQHHVENVSKLGLHKKCMTTILCIVKDTGVLYEPYLGVSFFGKIPDLVRDTFW